MDSNDFFPSALLACFTNDAHLSVDRNYHHLWSDTRINIVNRRIKAIHIPHREAKKCYVKDS